MPLVVCPDGSVLRNPRENDLAYALGMISHQAQGKLYDVVVVGAGPAGLSTAVYAASEGLSVAVMDCVPRVVSVTTKWLPFAWTLLTSATNDSAGEFSSGSSTRANVRAKLLAVTGSPFELPAGAVSTAFGFEYREDSIDARPDQVKQAGDLLGFNRAGAISGSCCVTAPGLDDLSGGRCTASMADW